MNEYFLYYLFNGVESRLDFGAGKLAKYLRLTYITKAFKLFHAYLNPESKSNFESSLLLTIPYSSIYACSNTFLTVYRSEKTVFRPISIFLDRFLTVHGSIKKNEWSER